MKEAHYCGVVGTLNRLCNECEGDCDTNADCNTGYKCHQRAYGGAVPGCKPDGTTAYDQTDDFCVQDSCENFKCSTGWEAKKTTPPFSTVKGATNEKCCDKTCALHTCPTGSKKKAGSAKTVLQAGKEDTQCCDETCASPSHKCGDGWVTVAANFNKITTDAKAAGFCCQQKCSDYWKKGTNACKNKLLADGRDDKAAAKGEEEKTCCRDKGKLWDVGPGDMGCSFGKLMSQCDTCEGDCDSDKDCQGRGFTRTDLVCFQRSWKQAVPGCTAGGDGDVATNDYCVEKSKIPKTRLYSDTKEVAATAPASAVALPYVGGLAMVSLVAFVYIRSSKSHRAREPELAEGITLSESLEDGEDETLE